MADPITNAQKAAVLVDGVNPLPNTAIQTSDANVVDVAFNPDADGVRWAIGKTAGTATLTVKQGTRTGTLAVTVVEAPLVITLGTPVPK